MAAGSQFCGLVKKHVPAAGIIGKTKDRKGEAKLTQEKLAPDKDGPISPALFGLYKVPVTC